MDYPNSSADDVSSVRHPMHITQYLANPYRLSASESSQSLWRGLEPLRETPRQQRFSWASVLPSWRLSRSELDSHALAVFSPLENDSLPLDFVIPGPKDEPIAGDEPFEIRKSCANQNTDLATRNMCILAVLFGVCIAVACFAIGTRIIIVRKWTLPTFLVNKIISMGNQMYPFPKPPPQFKLHYFNGHRVVSMPKVAMILASLVLNIGLTSIFDAMNLILSTTLRWTLFQEGRLTFNSNSRLFTSSRVFGPCHWTMNILSTVALVVGYGATAVLTNNIYIIGMTDALGNLSKDPVTGPKYALDFNAWGLIGLGSALLLQAGLCIWCLISNRRIVKSWSSNPLGTTRAYICAELEKPSSKARDHQAPSISRGLFASSSDGWQSFGSSESTVHSKSNSEAYDLGRPRYRQPPASSCVPQTRRFAHVVWIVLGIVSIWLLVVGLIARRDGSCTSEFVLTSTYRTDMLAYWQAYGQVAIQYVGGDPYLDRRDWLGLIIQSIGFSFISLGMHCVELLTEVVRDELTWRKATTTGTNPDAGSITQRMSSWPCWVLFAFKCITPWIFASAFDANLYVFMNLIPLCALVLVFLLLALFGEYLIRRKPKGPQPATYGNIRKLATFVDEWDHQLLFWGDKGMFSEGVRKCGTAGRRLAEVDMGMLYVGLKA